MLVEQQQWVLRNARLHAADPNLRTASGFAAAAGRATPVHRAQVGRWETGSVEVTYDLVRRYEAVLDLPEGQLLCAIDHFSRAAQPVRATATLVPRGEPDIDETLELLEQAISTSPMQGRDWDHLTSNLGRMPHAMIRRVDWEHLIRRCAQETAVATGLQFAQRDEAVARLAGHPRSGPVVAALAAEVLGDPSAQIYTDTIGLLQYTDHPQVVDVLLRQLRHPVNDDALRACLFALTTLVGSGRVPDPVSREAAALAVEHLREANRPFRVHRGAANLLHALDVPGLDRLAYGLTPENRRFVASILRQGRVMDGEALRGVQRRVRLLLGDVLPPDDEHERVLSALLRTATSESDEEKRSAALAILMLSPQGSVVGSAYAAELRRAIAEPDRVAVHECLAVLSWLGQAADLDLVTSLACAPSVASDLAMEAGIVVGNCSEPAGEVRGARELRVRDRILELVGLREPVPAEASQATGAGTSTTLPGLRGGPADDAEPAGPPEPSELRAVRERLRGLVYVLGMHGRFDLLTDLGARLDPSSAGQNGSGAAPQPGVRAVAHDVVTWWLDLPEHVRPVP